MHRRLILFARTKDSTRGADILVYAGKLQFRGQPPPAPILQAFASIIRSKHVPTQRHSVATLIGPIADVPIDPPWLFPFSLLLFTSSCALTTHQSFLCRSGALGT